MSTGIDSSWAQGALVPPSDAAFNISCASRANVGLRVDTDYAARVDNTRRAGKQVGHYFFNGNINPTTCATFFVNNLHDYRAGDILAIDCEDEGGTGTRAWGPSEVLAFGRVVTSRLNVHPSNILLYMNYDVNHRYNWQAVADAGYQLWYARPDGNPTDQAYWSHWALRQYGIVGGLDRNETSTSLASLGSTLIGDDMSAQAEAQIANIYAGLFQGASVLIDGKVQKFNYGVLPIVAHNQTLIAGLSSALQALATSKGLDPVALQASIESAAKQGVADALKTLTVTVATK